MKAFRKDEGFTLVELMVVVLIIGILVAIAIPIFNAARASAQQRSCFANERTYEGAYQSFLAAGGTALTAGSGVGLATVDAVLVPNYIQTSATCDAGGTYTFTVAAAGANITMNCSTHNHY